MRVGDLMSFILMMAAVAAVGYGAYVGYRYWDASQLGRHQSSLRPSIEEIYSTFSSHQPMVCTGVSSSFEQSNSSTLYSANGSIRVDMNYPARGQTFHMLLTKDYLYSWFDGGPYIISMSIKSVPDEINDPQSGILTDPGSVLVAETKCSPWWSPDPKTFELPLTMSVVPYSSILR